MDQKKYFKRIGYNGDPSPTFEVLKELQKKHLFTVPFENLDIHYGNRIDLDIENIYDKIIHRNRGGFCYELNGLFYELLESIGFQATIVSARVYKKEEKDYTPEFDHLAIIVQLDKTDYLVDVGFGEFIFSPLNTEVNHLQHDLRETYRVDQYDRTHMQVSRQENSKWVPEYIFSLRERALQDFAGMCHYHQTSSESHFRQKKICSLPTDSGRITVTSDKVKIKQEGGIDEHELKNEEEFRAALWEYFRIVP